MDTPKTLKELLTQEYGAPGSKARDEFDAESKAFMIGELIKEERRKAKLTQAELAQRIGTQKSYISRLENGKSDIQLSTFFKIIEEGFGRKVVISIG